MPTWPTYYKTRPTNVIIGDEFNRELHHDTTGRFHTSSALKEIVRGMALTDA
jgi:hypothetical protein